MRTHNRVIGLCLLFLLVACTSPTPQNPPDATPVSPVTPASTEEPVELVVSGRNTGRWRP